MNEVAFPHVKIQVLFWTKSKNQVKDGCLVVKENDMEKVIPSDPFVFHVVIFFFGHVLFILKFFQFLEFG